MSYLRRAIVISCLAHGALVLLLLATVRLTPSEPDLLVIDFSISTSPGPAAGRAPVPNPPPEKATPVPVPLEPPPEPPVELAEVRPLKSEPEVPLPLAEPESEPEPEPEPIPVASPPGLEELPTPETIPEPVTSSPMVSAAGPGGDAAAGEPAEQEAGGEPPPAVDRYLEANFHYIMEDIQQGIVYPRLARRMGWEGKVLISFVVLEDGRVEDIEIVESSGFSLLDENAVQTIKKSAPFPNPPTRAILVVPVTYRLS